MKTYITVFALFLVAFANLSCHKNKLSKEIVPDYKEIKGIILTAADGSSAGTIGIPDVYTITDDYFSISVFPTPCQNVMDIYLGNQTLDTLKVNITVYNVAFPDAPTSYNGQKIKVDNKDIAGKIAYQENDVPANPRHGSNYQLDVSKFKNGFYRVCIRVGGDSGILFWDNAWVWH